MGAGGQQQGGGSGNGWYNGSQYAEEAPGAKGGEHVMMFEEGSGGPEEKIHGKANKNGESDKFESPYSKTQKGEQKEYKQVIGDYTGKAYQKMNQSKIPNSMKEFIKGYFSGLN